MALIEAAAAGLPIIASDIRGSREVLSCCEGAQGFTGLEELKRMLKRELRRQESIKRVGRTEKIPVQQYWAEGRRIAQAGRTVGQKSEPGRLLECFDKQQAGRRMRKIYRRCSAGGRD